MSITRIFLLFLILVSSAVTSIPIAKAQSGPNDFSLGIQLMREGDYEEAYEIFRNLMRENPRSFALYERTVTALINLKRYDDAIAITRERLDHSGEDFNTKVKLGEIYHIAGRSDEAFETWNRVIDQQTSNLQPYKRVAETMNQRRLYREAVEVYKQARELLGEPTLYTFEIANNQLAIGDFEQALHEYLDILAEDERRLNLIQRQLVNYDERQLYDTAIIITQERIEQESPGSIRDLRFRDFLVWLNMERGLYQRALAAAMTLERYSDNQQHALFRIGRQLRTQQEFELAEEAFNYYLNMESHPLKARSYEELSRAYQDWAGYLIDHNLDFGGSADSLFRKAFETVGHLANNYPRYDRLMQILTIQSELALDHLKLPDDAAKYHEKMKQAMESESDEALVHYVEGRILLFEGDFSMARVAFTRSNRIAGSGSIAERSRYYLGLGDFYNSDFSYSLMQLRALERQNTSFFANDALRLRFMIQDAYDEDSANEPLKRYARARYLYDTGRYNDAAGLLAPILEEPTNHPLHGVSTLLLTRTLRRIHPEIAFNVLDQHTRRPSVRQNAGEQLLWERARLAELVHVMQRSAADSDTGSGADPNAGSNARSNRSGSSNGSTSGTSPSLIIPPELLTGTGLSAYERFVQSGDSHVAIQGEVVVNYYEELLMHYPDGFYADLARNRIQEIEREAREL